MADEPAETPAINEAPQEAQAPGKIVIVEKEGQRFAVLMIDGKIITSRGPGTAMDFALTLIELLLDKATRDKVEKPLQRPGA